MAIDLGSAPKQKEIMSGTNTQEVYGQSEAGNQKAEEGRRTGPESVTVYKSELKGLDLEFTVVSGYL